MTEKQMKENLNQLDGILEIATVEIEKSFRKEKQTIATLRRRNESLILLMKLANKIRQSKFKTMRYKGEVDGKSIEMIISKIAMNRYTSDIISISKNIDFIIHFEYNKGTYTISQLPVILKSNKYQYKDIYCVPKDINDFLHSFKNKNTPIITIYLEGDRYVMPLSKFNLRVINNNLYIINREGELNVSDAIEFPFKEIVQTKKAFIFIGESIEESVSVSVINRELSRVEKHKLYQLEQFFYIMLQHTEDIIEEYELNDSSLNINNILKYCFRYIRNSAVDSLLSKSTNKTITVTNYQLGVNIELNYGAIRENKDYTFDNYKDLIVIDKEI